MGIAEFKMGGGGFFMTIQPPFIVSYSITTKCNLKCKHCYSESIDQAAPDELTIFTPSLMS